MGLKNCLHFFVLTVFTLTNVSSKANEQKTQLLQTSNCIEWNFYNEKFNTRDVIIEKTTSNGLEIYSFSASKKVDTETIKAIENRLKVIEEGFISLSVDENNKVILKIDPSKITPERTDYVLLVTIKIYDYSNYKIQE